MMFFAGVFVGILVILGAIGLYEWFKDWISK